MAAIRWQAAVPSPEAAQAAALPRLAAVMRHLKSVRCCGQHDGFGNGYSHFIAEADDHDAEASRLVAHRIGNNPAGETQSFERVELRTRFHGSSDASATGRR